MAAAAGAGRLGRRVAVAGRAAAGQAVPAVAAMADLLHVGHVSFAVTESAQRRITHAQLVATRR